MDFNAVWYAAFPDGATLFAAGAAWVSEAGEGVLSFAANNGREGFWLEGAALTEDADDRLVVRTARGDYTFVTPTLDLLQAERAGHPWLGAWLGEYDTNEELVDAIRQRLLTDSYVRVRAPHAEGLAEVVYPVGTRRKRADGHWYVKRAPGQWDREAARSTPFLGQYPNGVGTRGVPNPPQLRSGVKGVWNPELGPMPPAAGSWKDKADNVPDSTWATYFNTESNTPEDAERAKLHEAIYAATLDHVAPPPEGTAPVLVVTMGPPASGKSTLLRQHGFRDSDFVHADSDKMKAFLPEFSEGVWQRARNSANAVHDESAYLVEKVREKAMASGKNLVADGTGSNLPLWSDLVKTAKARGYNVRVLCTDLPLEACKSRALTRAEETGRSVPAHVIESIHPKIRENFWKLAAMREADSVSLLDTSSFPPQVVWGRDEEGETVGDPTKLRDHRAASGLPEDAEPTGPPLAESSPVTAAFTADAVIAAYVRDFREAERVLAALKGGYGAGGIEWPDAG